MSHIFISYSRKDSDCAMRIVRRLEAQGFPVWIDQLSIDGGVWWGPEIQAGIRASAAALVIWSDNAKQSPHVADEIKWLLQHQAQYPQHNFQIIPIFLEPLTTTSLPVELQGISAVDLTDCNSYERFKTVLRRLSAIPAVLSFGRKLSPNFDKSKPLKDHADAQHLTSNICSIPLMQSVLTEVRILGDGNSNIAEHLEKKPATMQMCFYMRGDTQDYGFIQQVREFVGDDFMCLYITPKAYGGKFELNNGRPGQWLDIVNTSYSAASQLLGRGGATLQLFSTAPTVLSFAIGTRFYEFWHIQFFNRADNSYMMVLDNEDLPYKA